MIVHIFAMFLISGARYDIQMIQVPFSLSASIGGKVIITCKPSEDVDAGLNCYQQKQGKAAKLLICVQTVWSEVPLCSVAMVLDRFHFHHKHPAA